MAGRNEGQRTAHTETATTAMNAMTRFRKANRGDASALRRESGNRFRVTECRKENRGIAAALRHKSGIAAVTFAMVLPPFLIFVFMIIEVSWGRGNDLLVQRATVQTALDMIDVTNNINTEAAFIERFCRNAGPLLAGCDEDSVYVFLVAHDNLHTVIDNLTNTTDITMTRVDGVAAAPITTTQTLTYTHDGDTCNLFHPQRQFKSNGDPIDKLCGNVPNVDYCFDLPDPFIPTRFEDPTPNQFAILRICFQPAATGMGLMTPLRSLLNRTSSSSTGTDPPAPPVIQAATAFWNSPLRCQVGDFPTCVVRDP